MFHDAIRRFVAEASHKPKSDAWTLMLILTFLAFAVGAGVAGREAWEHYDVEFWMFSKEGKAADKSMQEGGERLVVREWKRRAVGMRRRGRGGKRRWRALQNELPRGEIVVRSGVDPKQLRVPLDLGERRWIDAVGVRDDLFEHVTHDEVVRVPLVVEDVAPRQCGLVEVPDQYLLFAGQFLEGEKISYHVSIVGQRVILVVLFDGRSSLGLVRLRVRKATTELVQVLDVMVKKSQSGSGQQSVFSEITDDDIDNLFND